MVGMVSAVNGTPDIVTRVGPVLTGVVTLVPGPVSCKVCCVSWLVSPMILPVAE